VQESLNIAQVIAILTSTLEALCLEEMESVDTYSIKQKVVNKISNLIDKIDGD